MSVVIETTIGDLTVDLYLKERPKTCLNFLKLCKNKAYNCRWKYFLLFDRSVLTFSPHPVCSTLSSRVSWPRLVTPLAKAGEESPSLLSYMENRWTDKTYKVSYF